MTAGVHQRQKKRRLAMHRRDARDVAEAAMMRKNALICLALVFIVVKISQLISTADAQTLSVGVHHTGSQYAALTNADGWGSVVAPTARPDDTTSQHLPLAYVPALYTLSQGVGASEAHVIGGDSHTCAIHCTQDAACAGYRMNSFSPPDCTIYRVTGGPVSTYDGGVNVKCAAGCAAHLVFLFDHTQSGLVDLNMSAYTVHMSTSGALIGSMSVVDAGGHSLAGTVSEQGTYAEVNGLTDAPHHANVSITTNGHLPLVFPPIGQTYKSVRDSNLNSALGTSAIALISIACIFVVAFIYMIARHTNAFDHLKRH